MMFEHLDDIDRPTLGDSFKAAVRSSAVKRRRRRRGVVLSAVSLPIVAVAGSLMFVQSQVDDLVQLEVGGLTSTTAATETAASTRVDGSPSSSATAVPPDSLPVATPLTKPITVILAGHDQAPDAPRADVVMLLRIDPTTNHMALLSLSRGLYIRDGFGGGNRLSTFTDPTALVEVVTELTSVPIDHYVQIDYEGFKQLVDLAGGVTVPFDAPMRDLGANFATDAGCVTLDGTDALAYVRARKLQSFDPSSGTWQIDPTSDIGRNARQQDLLVRLASIVLTADYSIIDSLRIVTGALDHIVVDNGLDINRLRSIFETARMIGAANMARLHLDITTLTISGANVLDTTPEAIQRSVDSLLGANPDEPEPADQSQVITPTGQC